ncbi:MAG TPA: homoprotocatechuate degradation operon regulator HpaR [Roseiarcus sp.]|nr:homoprotocatechuate degradation operon regulator HpaR [Roseiarcus sp.]
MALLRAREAVMMRFRPMLAEHGVTEQQWRVIRVLSEEGPLGASEVADRAAILGPSLTRIIKTLERRRMITSRRLPHDGRRVVLEIAAAGRAVIASAARERRKIYRVLERLHGRKVLDELLDRLEALILQEENAGSGRKRQGGAATET